MMGLDRNDCDAMLNLIDCIKGLIRGISTEDVDYMKELLDLKMDELAVMVKTAKIKSYPVYKKCDDQSSKNYGSWPSKVTWDLQRDPIKIPEGVPVPINANITPEEFKHISDLVNEYQNAGSQDPKNFNKENK